MGRCIGTFMNEGYPKKQAIAMCYSMWRKKHPSAKKSIEEASSDIQSLIFDKDKFTREESLSWAKSHNFSYNTIRETENTYRVRQFPPDECIESGGMKDLDEGVQGYVCIASEKSLSIILENISTLLNSLKERE